MRKRQIHVYCFFAVLISLKLSLISSVSFYYCENGNTQTIPSGTNGTIRTRLNGTSHYDNNLRCSWVIDAGEGNHLHLTISSVDLQYSPTYTSCGSYDHLSIKDGNTEAAPEITAICGPRNPYEIISSGQYLYLNFFSNDKNFYNHAGVSLSFLVFNNETCPPYWEDLGSATQCYRIRKNPPTDTDWYSAFSNCGLSQANLAVIENQNEYDKIKAFADSSFVTSAWIGLTDIETEGTYKWLNNQNLKSSSYIRTTGNSEDHNCAVFDFSSNTFNMGKCKRDKHKAVCQRNKVGGTEKYSIPTVKEVDKETVPFNIKYAIIIAAVLLACVIIVVVIVIKCKRQNQYKRAHGSQDLEMDSVADDNTPETIVRPRPERTWNTNSDDFTPFSAGAIQPSAPPPYEHVVQNTEPVSLRWKVILGISGGVIFIIICFVLYCKCRTKKPTWPCQSNNDRTRNYRPASGSTNRRASTEVTWTNQNSRNSSIGQHQRNTPPPRYSDIQTNQTGVIQFNPQINVNVTVNNEPTERPPAYSYY